MIMTKTIIIDRKSQVFNKTNRKSIVPKLYPVSSIHGNQCIAYVQDSLISHDIF